MRRRPLTRDEFADLTLRYLPDLAAFTRRLSDSAADGDDLLQATYELAFRSWQSLREGAACRAWLFRIARNLRTDSLRSQHARPELIALDDMAERLSTHIHASTVERVETVDLQRALERLAPEQREAVLLCDLWGFSYEEIAAIVGIPVGTVRSRISRGRARLLEWLSETASIHRRERS
jgi:RNA polymerase sigma-70 factor (ECF subfamily)